MCIISDDKECGRAILHTDKRLGVMEEKVTKLETDLAVVSVKIDTICKALDDIALTVKTDKTKSTDRLYQYLFWGVTTILVIVLGYTGLR